MICNSCKKQFDNISELKFCPYCGEKIEIPITEIPITENSRQDTVKMPVITEGDLKKYNRNKIFTDLINTFKQRKIFIPIITIITIIIVGLLGYKLLIAKPVDQITMNEDLIGQVLTLPRGTSIQIKESYIKSFSIDSRVTDKKKGKDDLKVAVTLDNGVVEVKTLLSMNYVNNGKNKWEFSGKVAIVGEAEIKPVTAMDDKKIIEDLKKLTLSISDESIALSGKEVKSLKINLRTPNLEEGKEEVLVTMSFDSGLITATGTIKCNLDFKDESWGLASIERNSNEDFKLALSSSFSQEKIIEIIKKGGLDETVTNKDLFDGKGFSVKDSFTKSIKVIDKKFDGANKTLTAIASRENTAGEIKSTLLTDYTFSVTLNNIALLKKSKTTLLKATVNQISNDSIIASITNAEIEGANAFFWFSDNHKITVEEAKVFRPLEILSKKGLNNIKYIYGNITYMDKKKSKNFPLVAIYFLVYDDLKGYNWKLDKIVGEDSPNYNNYSKAAVNQ